MSDKILIANAREAWSQACTYSNLILDGYITLQYKKMFVSTLHNSVELLMKQRMLDKNDYRVAKIIKIDSNGNPAREYYSTNNLNDYFKTNGTKDANGKPLFYSIEFHEFHDLHKVLFEDYYRTNENESATISGGLTLLANLRNDETHFYVNAIDFLNGSEFKTLHNFMISFAKILDFFGLLPTYSEKVTSQIKPNPNIPAKSDYKIFLKENEDVKKIAAYLNGKACRGQCDAFDIIDFLWFNTNFDTRNLHCKYEEAISLMTGVVQYNLVKIKKKKVTNDDGTKNIYDIYDFKI